MSGVGMSEWDMVESMNVCVGRHPYERVLFSADAELIAPMRVTPGRFEVTTTHVCFIGDSRKSYMPGSDPEPPNTTSLQHGGGGGG